MQRATTTIVSTLEVIAPSDPTALGQSVQTTRIVDKAFGLNASPAEQKYLEALAVSYHQAETWDAKRQIPTVMADLASFKQMQMFIPTLSEYKFKVARLHILLHGRGAPVPINRSPRMRINERALDHFLTFITSSHIIQDLPFGEKHLCGTIIVTPNVIRSIILSRIVEQYLSHCKEEGVTPMSKSTMLSILNACKATVRKSFLGLDYIAAEKAKAFDDLIDVINKLEGVKGVEWSSDSKHKLKKGKQYLKSDYKVKYSPRRFTPPAFIVIPVFSLSELHDYIDIKQFYFIKIQSTYEFVPSPLLKLLSCLFIYVREGCFVLTAKTASKEPFSRSRLA